MNICAAGHKKHERKVVPSIIGDLTIFDWPQYMGFKGYCTGQDGVSQTIENVGYWDIDVQKCMTKVLESGNRENAFLDIGCHIGYFSRLAEQLGYEVYAYDGDAENLELLSLNAPAAKGNLMWFDENTQPAFPVGSRFELAKIDIEGNEQYALVFLQNYLKNRLINNLIIEVSPVFNKSYPQLVEQMRWYGYDAYELNGELFNNDFNFHQKDLHFSL